MVDARAEIYLPSTSSLFNRRNPIATAASTHSVPVRSRKATTTRIADVASYWLIIAATYMTFGFQFYYASKEKLFDGSGTMPAGLAKGNGGPAR
jgi:hypothetical protein